MSQGKHAITHYEVLNALVIRPSCNAGWNRSHTSDQGPFRYIGHPLFNDEKYGGDKVLKGTTHSKYQQFISNCFALMPRQALHARSLVLIIQSTGQRMYSPVICPDFVHVLEKWKRYIQGRDLTEVASV